MTLTTELIYEDGVFKPTEPVAFADHTRVKVVITEPDVTGTTQQSSHPHSFERPLYYEDMTPEERKRAKQDLIASFQEPAILNSGGRKFTREELHERD